MDTTTVTSQPTRAWDLLADLAQYGRARLGGRPDLARRVADLASDALLCAWGLLLLQGPDGTATAGWGLSADELARLAARATPLPEQAIEIPLHHDDEPAGVLLLGPPADPTLLSPTFLGALRSQLELLIALQRREAEEQGRARDLYALYENAAALGTPAALDTSLARLAENVAVTLATDCAGVFRVDRGDPGVLVETAFFGAEQGPALPPRIALARHPLLGQALEHGEPVAVESDQAGLLRPLECRSGILVPLRSGGRTLGLLVAGLAQQPRRFSRAEIALAQIFGGQALALLLGSQIEQVEQRHVDAIGTLQAISQQLGSETAADELLTTILDGVARLVPTAAAEICLYQPADQTLHPVLSRGLRPSGALPGALPASDGLAGWVVRHRRQLRLGSLRRPPVRPLRDRLADERPVESYLGLPLQIGEALYGTLELFDARPDRFGPADEQLLTIVAGQAAQAIAGARRDEQADEHLRTRLQQLKSLQRLSRELTATLYLHNILGVALREALRATRATHGYVGLRGYVAQRETFDIEQSEALGVTASPQYYIALRAVADDESLRVLAAAGYSDEEYGQLFNQAVDERTTTAEAVLERGEALVVDELAGDDRPRAIGPAPAAALAVPIYYEAQVIGVVNLHSPTPSAFDRDALDFTRAVADQIALAIGNEERYYEQRRQRDLLAQRNSTLDEVLRIGQELRADRALDEVLEQIAFSAVETARFRSVVFFLVSADDPTRASLAAAAGLPLAEVDRLRRASLPLGLVEQLCDRRYRVGRCYYVPGDQVRALASEADLRLISTIETEGTRAGHEWQPDDTLIVPLYSTGARLVGVMLADEPYDRHRPTARTVEPIEIFADQAAIAIENASLLREARSQAEQMAALYRASAATVATLNLDDLVERVYGEIVEYMGVPSFCYIASVDPQRELMRFELFKREGVTLERLHKTVGEQNGLTGWIIRHGKMLHIADFPAEQERLPVAAVSLGEPVRSWVGIPLKSQQQVIGVLSVQSFEPRAFSERDVQWLSTVANQLAVGMANAQLFHERERRIGELAVINSIGHITSSTLDIERMFGQVFECLAGFLTVDAFYACVYHPESDEIAMALSVAGGAREFRQPNQPPAPGSLTCWIVSNRQPLRYADVRQGSPQAGDAAPLDDRQPETASWLGVPLLIGGGEVVGVLSIQGRAPALYGEREQAFLTTVASQVALGVQNARLFAERERQIVELDALGRIGRVTSSTLELRPMAEGIERVLREALDLDALSMTIISPERGRERVVTVDGGRTRDDERPLLVGAERLATAIVRAGRPLRVGDLGSAGYDDAAEQRAGGQPARSFLGVPILAYDGTPTGALALLSRRAHAFGLREESFLANVGAQVSLGVQNAYLFAESRESATALQRKVGELSTLLQAAQVLSSSLQPAEVLDRLMAVVGQQLLVNTVALWKIGDDAMLTPAAMQGIALDVARSLRVPVGQGLTGRVAASGRPLVVANVEDEGSSLYPQFNRDNQYTSFMGVPVVFRDKTIGVLSVMTVRQRDFSADEVTLLAGMADQAAIALENARLFAEREQRIAELTALNRVSSAINATLDSDEIVQVLHRGMAEVLDTSESFIALYDAATRRLTFPLVYDHGRRSPSDEADTYIVEQPAGLTSQVVIERRPLLLHTQQEIEALDPTPTPPGERPVCSWLGVPIMQGDEVLGVLNVQSYEPNRFDEDALRFLTTLANQAAVALSNARLFARVRRFTAELEQQVDARTGELQTANGQILAEKERLQAVHAITLELTASLELEKTLNRALELAASAVGARRGSIMLHDQEHGQLNVRAVLNSDGSVESKSFAVSFERGAGLAGWVMREQEAVCIADVHGDPRWLREEGRADEVRSVIAAPLRTQDGPLGVLILSSPRVGFFKDDQLQLLATIANEVAIVIHNATLYTVINEIASERGELWAQQREENSKNQAILQSLGEGVIVLDEQRQVVLFNQAAEQMLGIPAGFVVGHLLARVGEYGEGAMASQRARQVFDGLSEGLRALGEQSNNHNRILELQSPPQTIALNFALWTGPRDAVFGSVVVLRDITREIEADRAKRDFISSVSHELRTPLTSIKGYVDLLLLGAGGPLSEGQLSFLSVVKNNANRLMDLINDILEIGRIDSDKIRLSFEQVEIGNVFQDVLQTLRAEVERKALVVSVDVAEPMPEVTADARRLTQVVLNLVSNAVKYTYPSGKVALRAFLNPAGLLQVDVTDNGVGISHEQQQLLFRRFYRADNPLRDEAGGTGLGLSIARSFVELHGGEMWVESEVGKGSTFSFIIPLTQPEQEERPEAA